VVPKTDVIPDLFTPDEAERLLEQGASRLDWAGHEPANARVILTAVGAYQLAETLKASQRLAERGVRHSVVYMLEPGRFRSPRSEAERDHVASSDLTADLYPEAVTARLFVSHTRPEPLLGVLQPLHTGANRTAGLGFINRGGTYDIPGIMFANHCSWAHIVLEAARLLALPREELLTLPELAVLDGQISPEGVVI
jgi:phosphoketolase